jgi:hypothetical protein
MRHIFALLFGLCFTMALQGQTLLFSENFETNTLPDSVTYSGSGVWGKSSTLFSQGSRSDSLRIPNVGDSVVMTTNAFSTAGNSFVMLHFDHICKIDFYDEGFIEVSNNNGLTWVRLTGAHYLGTSQFPILGNKFMSASYGPDWNPNVNVAPANSWWRSEVFDISTLVTNSADVRVRFVLRDPAPGVQQDNYAWFIDNIRVLGSNSEITPPTIALVQPLIPDTVYSIGPFAIHAEIVDASGIDTAYIVFSVNSGTPDTVGMINTSGNLFSGSIPPQTLNSTICYKVVAVDGSAAKNTSSFPSLGCQSFFTKQAMMGPYSVGGAGADYATIPAAITALNTSGVSGPVEFLIAPGTYSGQITLTTVIGMDHVNTVTFRSANNDSTSVILQYAATSTTDNWVVRFDGASHFVFRQLTIKATGASNGRGIEFINGPRHIKILNCAIETNTTATGSAFAPVFSSTTLGPQYITISNSRLTGGYYGVYWYGSSTNRKNHFVFTNNIVEECYYYGVYPYYADSLFIDGNTITSRTTSGVFYGIYIYYLNGYSEITRNRIIGLNTTTYYGIALLSKAATSPLPALVANNYVTYIGTGTTNTVYAIYLTASNNVNIYHNSVSVYGGSPTAGRAFYQTTGTNIDIKNNIFANYGGGYAYYINTPTAIIGSNYNNYYATGSSLAYWTAAHSTVAGLQSANGTDANSLNLAPPFTSNVDLTLISSTLSGKGIFLPSVPKDINGNLRPAVPTLGAYEIPLIPKDAGVVSFVTPTSQSVIGETAVVPVTLTIINMGTDSLTSVDVYYQVNGGTPVSATFNGLLYQFQTASVVMPTFVSPAGQVELKAWTTLPGDTNHFNDTALVSYYGIPLFDASMNRIIPLASSCGLGLETIQVVIENVGSATIPSNFTVSYRLDNTSTIVTHTVPSSIPVNDSLVFAIPTPVDLTASVDTVYKLFAWVTLAGDNVQVNDTTEIEMESNILPPPPVVVSPVNIAYGAQATLNATSNLTKQWTSSISSTVILDTGAVFTTPYLYDTTTYYVQSVVGSSQSYYVGPLNPSIGTISASTLTNHFVNFNVLNPNGITLEAFDMFPTAATIGSAFTIVVQNSAQQQIASYSGVTTTSGGNLQTVIANLYVPFGTGYRLGFTTNPGFNRNTTGAVYPYTVPGEISITGNTFDVVYLYFFYNWKVTTGSAGSGCVSAKVPVQVNIGTPPPVDAGIEEIDNPKVSVASGTPQEIKVKLKNYGTNTLTSADIVWSLNGVVQNTFVWTGTLAPGTSQLVVVDTAIFQGGVYCINAWTSYPNGFADTVNTNDTATSCFNACLAGTFTIGTATTGSWDFNSFNSALNALATAGICGHVIFDVQPGTYTEQLTIPAIVGMDANNTVTFRGLTSDSTAVVLQFAATSTTDNWVVRLNGSSFFTFSFMTIKATGTANGRVIEFMANASDNTITNCVIETNTTATTTTFAGIYSTTGLNIHRATFANNRVIGGYYSIYWNGASASVKNNVKMLNNVLVDYYYYGIYTNYADSVIISGNRLSNRTGAGILYPVYVGYTTGYGEVTKNFINSTGTSTHYGIYIAYKQTASTVPFLVANNMLTQSGNLTGTVYGIYLLSSNFVNVYYNSIRIEGGSAANGRAMFLSSGTVVNVVNNIFSNHNGGYAYYVTTPSNVVTGNYNNFYSTGTSLAYWGADCSSLTALQTLSLKEQNSQNINPPFTSATDLYLANSSLSSKAFYLAQVPDDIYGTLRTMTPTIGAHELPLIPNDAGVSAILSPGGQTDEGQTYPVEVTVKNFGTDPINGALTIVYSINGGAPVSFLYNDTLQPNATANVVLPSMISPAGNAVICAWTILANDSNLFNDQFCKTFFGVPINDARAVRVILPEDGCNLGLDTIKLVIRNIGAMDINAPTSSVITASYQVDGLSPVVTESVTQTILTGDSLVFTFQTLYDFSVTSADSLFNVAAWVKLTGDNVLYNDTAHNEVMSLRSPLPPVVTGVTIPYATFTTLNALSPDSLYWYAQDTSTTELQKGPSFLTPVLYTNTTYWVEAKSGGLGSGGNIALTAVAAHSSGGATTYGPANYNDGIISAHGSLPWGWVTTNGWVEFTWPAPVTFNAVKFYKDNRPMITCTFQYWDGANYVNFLNYNSSAPEDSVTFPPVTSTRLRFNAIAGSSNPNFREIEVFEPKQAGCPSPRVPVVVTVSNQSACDVGVVRIIQPLSAVALGSQEPVRVRLRNFGTQAHSNIPVSFQVDNLPVVTETFAGPLAFNDSVDFLFNAQANLAVAGTTYQIKAWTGLSCDNTHLNDTTWKSVTNLLPNYCVSSATSALYAEITNVTLGTMSHTTAPSGAMYSNHTITALPPMLSPGLTYTMSVTSSFAPGSTTSYNCWVKAWIDFNRDGIFDPLTEEVMTSTTTNNNTVTLTFQVPFTAINGNTVMRVVLQQTTTASLVVPCGTYTNGETEDYMVTIAPQAACDAGVIQIISPESLTQSGVALPVWVKFINFGSDPIPAGNLSLAYKLNNGTPVVVPYPGAMASGAIDSMLLGTVTLPIGNNTLCAYTILACDSNIFNNEICKGVYGQYQTTLPYFDDFEASNMWYKPQTSVNWQYGTPSANVINSAYSGNKAWVTNLSGDYTNNADEYLYSPLFSFNGLTGLDTITLSFYHWNAMATGDYGRVQYSINGGQSWSTLGFYLDQEGTNWYNVTSGGLHYFSHTNSGWMYSAYKLSPATFNGQQQVQFRFQLFSTASGTANGWAIDNFRLSLPVMPNDVGISAINVPLGDTAVGTSINVNVTISNYGSNTQNMIPLELRLNGNLVTSETWTGNLLSQGTAQYTFVIPFTVPSSGYTLCARTVLPGDPFVMNNEFCKNLMVQPAFHDVGITAILAPIPDSINQLCFYDSLTHLWYKKDVIVRIQNFGQNVQS